MLFAHWEYSAGTRAPCRLRLLAHLPAAGAAPARVMMRGAFLVGRVVPIRLLTGRLPTTGYEMGKESRYGAREKAWVAVALPGKLPPPASSYVRRQSAYLFACAPHSTDAADLPAIKPPAGQQLAALCVFSPTKSIRSPEGATIPMPICALLT